MGPQFLGCGPTLIRNMSGAQAMQVNEAPSAHAQYPASTQNCAPPSMEQPPSLEVVRGAQNVEGH